jgi:hypothetical protein
MKKSKRILCTILLLLMILCVFSVPAYALEESEVQEQVDAVGKETVTGNLLIWFMCAIAFLKVSQKLDTFLSSLGLNVGHTGGSLLSEAMITAKSIAGSRVSRGHGSGQPGNSAGSGSSIYSGGLAGMVGRQITKGAVQSVSGSGSSPITGVGGSVYTSSAAKGGAFASSVIGAVATGNINTTGTITGEKAVQAMHSYMGFAAMEPGAKDVPSYSDVEIGGGRITGTETSPDHPDGIAFGMYHTDQYTEPEGKYETVRTADGASWYKQYAAEAVKKTPYITNDGNIAYRESLITKLPPMPKRKDRL